MEVIKARNVNDALPQGLELLRRAGDQERSRYGLVLRAPWPVTTVYARPCERVLFDPARDANPFFHMVEALWMLAGRDDLKALKPYAKKMAEFSDDGGVTSPGAYGKRWRDWSVGPADDGMPYWRWGDQLDWAVGRLRADHADRRVVIQMWDPGVDPARADAGGKDVPCNLTATPWVHNGALHLTVFCRSNDVVWGAYGANAVHFSFLLEYLAARVGLPTGTYTQVSNNYHAYLDTIPEPAGPELITDPYALGMVEPWAIFDGVHPDVDPMGVPDDIRERQMREDLSILFEHGWREAATKARWPYLRRVAAPMMAAHEHYRNAKGPDRYVGALEILEQCQAADWRLASVGWIQRRYFKTLEKTDA